MRRPCRLWTSCMVTAVLAMALAAPAAAQKKSKKKKDAETPPPPAAEVQASPSKVAEADARFTRGVELFNEGDYAAALAEFHWAYNIEPHYAVLYNIAVCYVKLGRYVDALTYYNRYLEDGGSNIPQTRLDQVKEEITYISSLMGHVMVKANLDGVVILVDGKESGKTPLAAPLFVPAGPHDIELAIAGWLPVKDEITIAGGASIEKSYTLQKDKRSSTVTIIATAPHAKVYVDGSEMGKSPWTGDLAVGEHEVKVSAPGYRDAFRPIVVHPEEEREIEIEMEIAGTPGKLSISSNTQGADVWLEQQAIGTLPMKSYEVPPGMYHVSVSKEGYKGWEGDISIKEGALTKLDLTLGKTTGKLHPWAFSLTFSLAIAAATTAGVMGYMTLKTQEEFDEYPDRVAAGLEGANAMKIQNKYDDLAEKGKRYAIATDICIGLAAVTGVTAVFLAFFTQFKKPESKATIKIGSAGAGLGLGLSLGGAWSFQ